MTLTRRTPQLDLIPVPEQLKHITTVVWKSGGLFTGDKKMAVIRRLVDEYVSIITTVGTSDFTRTQMNANARKLLAKESWWSVFEGHFPNKASNLLGDTLEYLQFYTAEARMNIHRDRHVLTGSDMAKAKMYKEAKGAPSLMERVTHTLSNLALYKVRDPYVPKPESNRTLYDRFLELYNAMEYESAMEVYGVAQGFDPDPMWTYMAHPSYHEKSTPDSDVNITITIGGRVVDPDDLPSEEDYRTPSLVPLLISHPLAAPTNTVNTLVCALRCRNQQAVPVGDRHEWEEMTRLFCTYLHQMDIPLDTSGDWISEIAERTKRERIQNVYDGMEIGSAPELFEAAHALGKAGTDTTQMFPKTNETLYPKEHGGSVGMKPRTIIKLSDKAQVITQPYIKRATELFKANLKDTVISVPTLDGNDANLHLSFTSGYTSHDLTMWLAHAEQRASIGVSSFAIMGDDSYGVVVRDEEVSYLEIDYSHYDQSQRAIQVDCETEVLGRLGVPYRVASYLADLSSKPSKFRRGKKATAIKVRLDAPFRKRQSGSPHTSLGNSINNMLAIMILAKYGWNEERAWPVIGFKAKSKWHEHACQGTFLRGMFWRLDHPVEIDGVKVLHKWSWMPSAVCKMGKIQRALTRSESIEGMAKGMAYNISSGKCDVPILGAFRDALLRGAGRASACDLSTENYRPTVDSNLSISRNIAVTIICERYGIAPKDVEEIEQMYGQVHTLPAFVQHRALRRIVEVDYA